MSNILHVQKSIATAQFIHLAATPVEIVRAPGTGKTLVPLYVGCQVLSTGHTPYAAGDVVELGYLGATDILELQAARFTQATDNFAVVPMSSEEHGALATYTNKALQLTTAGSEFTGGTGTEVLIDVWYVILD